MFTRQRFIILSSLATLTWSVVASPAWAQTPRPTPAATAIITTNQSGAVNQDLPFDATKSILPTNTSTQEVLWDFGDGVRTTGDTVNHSFRRAGTYTVNLTITTDQDQRLQDSVQVRIFDRTILLLADTSASDDQLALVQQQAADAGVLVVTLKARTSGPEALIEEDLTQQLLDNRAALSRSPIVVLWTAGVVGPNVLIQFAQHIHQSQDPSLSEAKIASQGIVLLSQTPFGVLSRTAQSAFDQLQPNYILLTRPDALPLLFKSVTADQARAAIFASPIEHRLLGTFSQRAINTLSPTNFMSVGLNFLVNRGVPINNIILLLMLPVIATILAFTRQVIGIKAFGLITPAMTTLAFLVMGLRYGLAVFLVVLLSGTVTRILVRRLRLLYLPRMALVLTSASLATLVLLGLGVAADRTAILSFSIFPILILIILAEEFIAVQFKRGGRVALTTTAWTLVLAITCYYIISWELFRTLLLSYPEIILLAIPLNILLGRWQGLRLVEYIRFRELMRYGSSTQ